MKPLAEQELRHAVLAMLAKQAESSEARVVEELQIELGAARVDIAVISQQLQAFELKSDLDNFGRLHNQIHAYNRVFDRITIVTGPQYRQGALEVVPSWWGVIQAERLEDGAIRLIEVRAAQANQLQEPRSIASFLWREEASDAVRARLGVEPKSRAGRHELQALLAEGLVLDELKEVVTGRLRTRTGAGPTPKPSRPRTRGGDSSHLDASCLDFLLQAGVWRPCRSSRRRS